MGRLIDIKGLINASEIDYKLITEAGRLFVDSGVDKIDDTINGFEGGRITLITGRPGEGKSTFVHRIALYAVNSGIGTLIVDGEHQSEDLLNNLHIKLIGYDEKLFNRIKFHRKYIKQPTEETHSQLKQWTDNKLWIYSKSDGEIKSLPHLFTLYKQMIENAESKIRFVILDNLMSLLDYTNVESQNMMQAEFMNKCKDLATSTGIHIILVAHPNKTAEKGAILDYYQISGASELANLTDNVIQVGRNYNENEEHDGFAHISKNRGYGIYETVLLDYEKTTGTLVEHGVAPKKIKWQKPVEEKLKIKEEWLNDRS